jgi:hypothetical protein
MLCGAVTVEPFTPYELDDVTIEAHHEQLNCSSCNPASVWRSLFMVITL